MLPARALPDIGPTFGALLIGGYASLGLFGVLTLQCWLYYTRFPDDTMRIKFMVVFIWVVEFLRSCFMVHAIHYYTVVHWGDPTVLSSAVWSLELILFTTFIVEFVVHLYFAYRVWIISGHHWLMTSIICFFTISNFVIGICEYAYSIVETTFSRISNGFTGDFATAALTCVIAADWTITGSLIYYLRRNRSESGWSRTNTIVDRLVFYAINIGILMSATDLVVLALSSSHLTTTNLYYLALFEIVGNLYANSLLASLNARAGLRQQVNVEYLSSFNVGAASQRTQQSGTTTKASTALESGPADSVEQKLSASVSDLVTTGAVPAAIV